MNTQHVKIANALMRRDKEECFTQEDILRIDVFKGTMSNQGLDCLIKEMVKYGIITVVKWIGIKCVSGSKTTAIYRIV